MIQVDVTGSTEFLTEAAALAGRLQSHGRSVFEIHYFGLSFGNWTLTAGTAKRRVLVSWDGREAELTAETGVFADSQSRAVWREVLRERIEGASPVAALRHVETIIVAASGSPVA